MDLFIKDALEKTQGVEREVEVGKANITVFGCGGAGNNIVSWLKNQETKGAKIIALNTDKQHLDKINADEKFLIGNETTRGLGCGGDPKQGEESARENAKELKDRVKNSDMVFVCAGMGGGTGTGSAPVVAKIAKASGAIVVGTVTMPFAMERLRVDKAEIGLHKMRKYCDSVIVIDNNRLTSVAGNLPLNQAFNVANNLISTMIKGIVETIVTPSLINLDFADLKAIMSDSGVAAIGVGSSDTKDRVSESVKEAMDNPLIDVDYEGATGALINIQGGPDMTLDEVNKAIQMITQTMDNSANVIFGARIDEKLSGQFIVMSIVTGLKSKWVKDREKRAGSLLHDISLDAKKTPNQKPAFSMDDVKIEFKEEKSSYNASGDFETLDLGNEYEENEDEDLQIRILN